MTEQTDRKFPKRTWLQRQLTPGNLIFWVFVLLMLIPATRMPIQVQLIRLFSFAPSSSSVMDDSEAESIPKDQFNLTLIDESGEMVDLAQFRGNRLFINHWATWCPPCVAEMPSIDDLYKEASGDAVFILMSSQPIEKLKAFKADRGYSFPVYQYVSPLPPWMTRSNSIPATFVVDAKDQLRLEHRGAKKWNSSKFQKALLNIP